MNISVAGCLLSGVLLNGYGTHAQTAPDPTQTTLEPFTSEQVLAHIKVLSSDAFEGRAPGTKGEEQTVAYLSQWFLMCGLTPGNPDGTYVQSVPLLGLTAKSQVGFKAGEQMLEPNLPFECVASSRVHTGSVKVEDSELVFCGYGVVAPEFQWDDYKGVDLRGKTLIVLVNDPPVADSKNAGELDAAVFKGRAMTYYGRWTYKYEIASAKGAAACLIVHETGPAGYPYAVVSGSFGRENFDIESADKNAGRVPVEGWLAEPFARKLLLACGQDYDKLKAAAARRDFKPVALGAKAGFAIETKLRPVASRNVVAMMKGSDPKLADEYVLYTAHWDHLGRDDKLAGDTIYNGAADNASGTAALLELAEAMKFKLPAPKRSVVFLAVTAEEKGLLGSLYYAEHPLWPLERTLAAINIDGINLWGKTGDVVSVTWGSSSLDEILEGLARSQGRHVAPDPEPEKGSFYRSDHFNLAKRGVPVLYLGSGVEYVGRPEGWGRAKRQEYTQNDYHKPSDEVKSAWDLSGGLQDLELYYQVGLAVANGERWPEWKSGAEFAAVRKAMLEAARSGKR